MMKGGFRVSDMLCLNGSLIDLYIYVNYSILYSYGQINIYVCMSVCLKGNHEEIQHWSAAEPMGSKGSQ